MPLIPVAIVESGGGGGLFDAYAYLRDEKAANTAGGVGTTGSFQTRTLNTEVFDPSEIVSLSANQFTLQTGTYYVQARSPFLRCSQCKIKLRNVTDGTDELIGSNPFSVTSSGGDSIDALLVGRFTIASPKTYEIQYRIQNNDSGNANCLGIPANFGVVEVYTEVVIFREG